MAVKWMGKARAGMEKRGTVGSLRAIAKKRGLLSGKDDKLTADDLKTLMAAARRMKDTALMRKVMQAANMMGAKIGPAPKKGKK